MQTSPTTNVCTTTTNVCTTTKTVAGCRGKRLQTFANVCKRCGSRNGRPAWASGPGTARPRGAWAGLRNGRACGRGPGAAFTAWPDRHPLARTAHVAQRCGARGCVWTRVGQERAVWAWARRRAPVGRPGSPGDANRRHQSPPNRACRKAGAKRGPRRDGDTRLIESRIVLELQSARGIRSAYGSIGT